MARQKGGGAAIIQDNPNWRRFRHACIYYRERWATDGEAGVDGHPLLYQIICLQNTPPENHEEQNLCLSPRKVCWRLRPASAKKKSGDGAAAASASRSGDRVL